LVAVSQAARADSIRYLGISSDKVEVIHHGISEPMRNWARDRSESDHLPSEQTEPYVLNVATFYHHKNLLRLIDAFALMRREWNLNHRLRLIGADADLSRTDLQVHARAAGVEAFVDLYGPVDHREIAAHYASAALFVYPSLYETFGHPPLEAMVAGCPVVAANSSAIPEVVGDAALLVEPTDTTAIAEAMGSVLTDPALRKRLVAKGTQRVEAFSWARAADSYLDILDRTRRRQ
jgi:glycosyltransferase involved in cell wall biosynthesis